MEKALLSGDEVLSLGITQPFELVKGKIVYLPHASDIHGFLTATLAYHLGNLNVTHKVGWVLSGNVGVYTRYSPDTIRAVDVIFVSRQRLPVRSGKALRVTPELPELIVEIISPSDRGRDVRAKREEYFAIGVEQVWVVEPEHKSVLVFRSPTDLVKLTVEDTLHGTGVLTGFTLPLAELFGDL